ncbi:MAG TPA: antibiotic biosynthesis monooxygenase [Salegentibacter sp.]|nr:antibiotic biosynthesis monooxygenase [Salegentibacter sp.]
MKKLIFLLALSMLVFTTGCDKDSSENVIVIVKYKTQPNKSIDAITALKELIEEVKKEDHFVNIKLHVDQNDNSNIMLYEEWEDELYYQNEHMETQHLQDFMSKSREFLTGQPEISYWKLNAVYE